MMREAGVPWALRETAALANMGAGSGVITQTISFDQEAEDNITIVFGNGPMPPVTCRCRIGAGLQEACGEDGRPLCLDPTWTGSTLLFEGRLKDGKPMQPARRYIEDDELVYEVATYSGSKVRRYFSKS
jgi:hypothetical protein